MRFARRDVRGHIGSHKNDHEPFLSELQSLAASEASKNQLPRDFRRCSIFDFCNSIGAKRTFVETLIPARCQEETLAAQASILDLSSCQRGCRAADGNRTVRDERDAGGVEGVARSRAGRGNCFGER